VTNAEGAFIRLIPSGGDGALTSAAGTAAFYTLKGSKLQGDDAR
jgi:hypothetical protein